MHRGDRSPFVFAFFSPSELSSVTQLRCTQSLSLLERSLGRMLLWVTSTFHLGKSESMHAAPNKVFPRPPPFFFFCTCPNPAWFMEAIRSIGCKNPPTSTQVILFVVRMWLKHHLLSLKIRYRGRLGRGPVFSERFCPGKKKKKKSKKSSKIQTLKRLIRNRVKMS